LERQLQALMSTRTADGTCCLLDGPLRQPLGGRDGHGRCIPTRFASDVALIANGSLPSVVRVTAVTATATTSVASAARAQSVDASRASIVLRPKHGRIIEIDSAREERPRVRCRTRVLLLPRTLPPSSRPPLRLSQRQPLLSRSRAPRSSMHIYLSLAAFDADARISGFRGLFLAVQHARVRARGHRLSRRGDVR
jgi:hypothetical protein